MRKVPRSRVDVLKSDCLATAERENSFARIIGLGELILSQNQAG